MFKLLNIPMDEREDYGLKKLIEKLQKEVKTSSPLNQSDLNAINEIRHYRNLGAHGNITEFATHLAEEIEKESGMDLIEKKKKYLIKLVYKHTDFVEKIVKKNL